MEYLLKCLLTFAATTIVYEILQETLISCLDWYQRKARTGRSLPLNGSSSSPGAEEFNWWVMPALEKQPLSALLGNSTGIHESSPQLGKPPSA